MIQDHLLEQIGRGQGVHTVFFEDLSDIDRLAEAVCALLNSEGGTVFCGVSAQGQVQGVIATAVDSPSLSELHRLIASRVSPSALFTINADVLDRVPIVTIEVPAGKDRPYVTRDRIFIRDAAQTVEADASSLRTMIRSKEAETERWERRPSLALEESDLDHEEIRALVREVGATSRMTLQDASDDDRVLAQLGMSGPTGYTQGADVVFAKDPARRHPQARVRLLRLSGDKTDDEYLDDRQLQGPLVRVLNEAFAWVRAQIPLAQQLPVSASESALVRVEKLAYPLDAVREGLVNAFAHRDYAGFSGGLTVTVFSDRMEIWNSGRLPDGLTPTTLKRGHPSLPANPDIAQVLFLRGLMERVGRGTLKITQACEHAGLRSPQWQDAPTGVTLTLWGPQRVSVEDLGLNARQLALLAALNPNDRIRPAEYRERFAQEVSERQARRDLAHLEQQGLLRAEGAGAASVYVRVGPR